MKNIFKKIAALILAGAIGLSMTACKKEESEAKSIKVGFCPGPYSDMFKEAIQPSLEKKGYKIEIVEFSDYVQPNKALAAKEIDVNIFQHSTYLKKFSADNGLDLSYIKEIPTAGMGIFSSKYKSFDELPDGATVAIPNDETNLSRAIRVLQQAGLVKIKDGVDPAKATQNDLSENKKNLKFTEIEAPQLPRSLDSVDFAVINGNYAISAGLLLKDAIYSEELGEGYFNVIAVRTEDKDSQLAKDLIEITESDAFKSVIEDESKQYSSFKKPSGY
ncbi:MAG: MetQ/NlpA family ABC transporter substrate-binding protein [Oscillospiraceae bacterium]